MVDAAPQRGATRARRARRAASLARAAIHQAFDEADLVQEACNILVEQADYAFAYVAEALTGPGQAVQTLAGAGEDPVGPVARPPRSWGEGADRRSAAVRAIRDQRPVVDRPRAPDAGAAAPPTGATQAVAAFALPFPPHGLGALVVGANAGQEAFASAEVHVLRELAADLAAGLASLRERRARDRLEAELQAAQERYRGLIENAPEGILEMAPDGRIRLANRAFAALAGHASPAQLLAERPRLDDLLDAPDAERFRAAVQDDAGWPLEVRLRRRDGSHVWASLNATVVHSPDGEGVECFAQDLTAERARREAAGRLAAIVESTDEAIIALDTEGRVQSWNAGAAHLFGYLEQEAMGKPILDLIVPADRLEEAKATLATLLRAERVPHYETTRRRRNGSLVEVSVSGSPILDDRGAVVGIAVTQHDITERKRGEAARRVLERQEAEVTRLAELERMRAAFLSEASHEINTPLTTIRLQLDVLKLLPSIDERERASINIIEGSVTRMGRLVKDMLEASGLKAGRLKLQRTRTDMAKTLEDAVVTFEEYGKRAGVAIDYQPARRFFVDADPTRAMQVLFNLLSNAVKFTPRGGRIEVSAQVGEGMATVCVRDHGLGMTQEQLDGLFVPFGRLHEHVPGIALGTGLGLFISKGIVEQHGGKLWATSEGPGKGSTFCFTLPLAPPPKEEDETPSATRPVVVRKKRTPDGKVRTIDEDAQKE